MIGLPVTTKCGSSMLIFLGAAAFLASAPEAVAQSDILADSLLVLSEDSSSKMSSPIHYLILMTALSLIPAFVISATAFTRIIVVLAMLRTAMGLQNTPPNSVVLLLALFLTLFTMQPVLSRVEVEAYTPFIEGEIKEAEAITKGILPFKEFMLKQTSEKDLVTVVELSEDKFPQNIEDVKLLHLTPAFLLSELKTAFQMGFVLFLPFILIDLIVASTLMGLGMIMLPPMTISLPLKVLVFVLSDGWRVLTQSLLGSF